MLKKGWRFRVRVERRRSPLAVGWVRIGHIIDGGHYSAKKRSP
jgi:hypothetical protein